MSEQKHIVTTCANCGAQASECYTCKHFSNWKSQLTLSAIPEKIKLFGAFKTLPPPTSAFATQVGGNHYKTLKIQPAEFCEINGLGFLESSVIKRMCRWKNKDGFKDLEKAIHEIQLIMEVFKEGKEETKDEQA